MASPECPEYGVTGIEKIVSTASAEKSRQDTAWLFIARCDDCGHVYGISAKHVFGRSGPRLIVDR
jgi:hypothetical protein